MNKFVSLLTASSLALTMNVASATPAYNAHAATAMAQASKAHAKLSFVMEVAHASLTQIAGHHYQLVVPIGDIKSILAFSAQPSRIAFRMTPNQYAKAVHSGKNSFDIDPPNAVVSFSGIDSAFEIIGFEKTDANVVYQLNLLDTDEDAPMNQSGPMALFVDSGFLGDY